MRKGSGEFSKGNQEGGVEDMYDYSDIKRSVEMPIGTRFYFLDRLYEVTELKDGKWDCHKCAFDTRYTEAICGVMKCNDYRQDKKCIFFKEVEEKKEEQ